MAPKQMLLTPVLRPAEMTEAQMLFRLALTRHLAVEGAIGRHLVSGRLWGAGAEVWRRIIRFTPMRMRFRTSALINFAEYYDA